MTAAHPDLAAPGRPGGESESLRRYGEYLSRLRGLRSPARRGDTNRWLLVAGGILVPLGIFLVLLGWSGAAATPLVFEQIPYLISGGLLGVGLMVLGGLLYFSYWMTILVRETRHERRELLEILAALRAGTLPTGTLPTGEPRAAGQLVATARGSTLHRPECPVVAGREGLREVTTWTERFSPCGTCNPPAGTRAPRAGAPLRPAAAGT
jgi:hypothetical protein